METTHTYLDLPLPSALEVVVTESFQDFCCAVTHVDAQCWTKGPQVNHTMPLTCSYLVVHCSPMPPDSILEAVLTVSPKRQ